MRYRKLRIAWSVVWGVAALLLIVLCVRSYRNFGSATWRSATDSLCVYSAFGHLLFVEQKVDKPQFVFPHWQWLAGSKPITDPVNLEKDTLNYHKTMGFGWGDELGQRFLMAPYWFIAVLSGAVGGLPWFCWRFSLRTLLIATTLMAIVLGLIVWAARRI